MRNKKSEARKAGARGPEFGAREGRFFKTNSFPNPESRVPNPALLSLALLICALTPLKGGAQSQMAVTAGRASKLNVGAGESFMCGGGFIPHPCAAFDIGARGAYGPVPFSGSTGASTIGIDLVGNERVLRVTDSHTYSGAADDYSDGDQDWSREFNCVGTPECGSQTTQRMIWLKDQSGFFTLYKIGTNPLGATRFDCGSDGCSNTEGLYSYINAVEWSPTNPEKLYVVWRNTSSVVAQIGYYTINPATDTITGSGGCNAAGYTNCLPNLVVDMTASNCLGPAAFDMINFPVQGEWSTSPVWTGSGGTVPQGTYYLAASQSGSSAGVTYESSVNDSPASVATVTATNGSGSFTITPPAQVMSPLKTGSWNLYIGYVASWQQANAYPLNFQITDSNGNTEQVTAAGTSGASHPAWATTLGSTTADSGTLVWKLVGLGGASNNGAIQFGSAVGGLKMFYQGSYTNFSSPVTVTTVQTNTHTNASCESNSTSQQYGCYNNGFGITPDETRFILATGGVTQGTQPYVLIYDTTLGCRWLNVSAGSVQNGAGSGWAANNYPAGPLAVSGDAEAWPYATTHNALISWDDGAVDQTSNSTLSNTKTEWQVATTKVSVGLAAGTTLGVQGTFQGHEGMGYNEFINERDYYSCSFDWAVRGLYNSPNSDWYQLPTPNTGNNPEHWPFPTNYCSRIASHISYVQAQPTGNPLPWVTDSYLVQITYTGSGSYLTATQPNGSTTVTVTNFPGNDYLVPGDNITTTGFATPSGCPNINGVFTVLTGYAPTLTFAAPSNTSGSTCTYTHSGSTLARSPVPHIALPVPFEGEFLAWDRSGSGKIWRFGQNYLNLYNGMSNFSYDSRGHCSPDNCRYFLYTSDMESGLALDSNGSVRTDTFIVEAK
jgi:hypothetical protein